VLRSCNLYTFQGEVRLDSSEIRASLQRLHSLPASPRQLQQQHKSHRHHLLFLAPKAVLLRVLLLPPSGSPTSLMKRSYKCKFACCSTMQERELDLPARQTDRECLGYKNKGNSSEHVTSACVFGCWRAHRLPSSIIRDWGSTQKSCSDA
jgi:hypothetical protein